MIAHTPHPSPEVVREAIGKSASDVALEASVDRVIEMARADLADDGTALGLASAACDGVDEAGEEADDPDAQARRTRQATINRMGDALKGVRASLPTDSHNIVGTFRLVEECGIVWIFTEDGRRVARMLDGDQSHYDPVRRICSVTTKELAQGLVDLWNASMRATRARIVSDLREKLKDYAN